jgi:hypothetical protein
MSTINPPPKIPDGLLWHYTDFNGFNGIRQGSMWASDINYLNDSAEVKHLFDVAATVFRELQTPYTNWDAAKILDHDFRNWVKELAGNMYVSCFSKKRADDLSQWRGYARRSPGFALGFAPDALTAAAEAEGFDLVPCEYSLGTQKDTVTTVVRNSYAALRAQAGFDENANRNAIMSKFYNETFMTICRLLVVECMRSKSPAFTDEEEQRVISRGKLMGGKTFADVHYRQSGSLIVPYVTWKVSPLRFVLVGPSPHADDVIAVVKRMCPGIDVGKSAVPYRNW